MGMYLGIIRIGAISTTNKKWYDDANAPTIAASTVMMVIWFGGCHPYIIEDEVIAIIICFIISYFIL